MKLVTFQHQGQDRLGAFDGAPGSETVVDLARCNAGIPSTMIAFLAGGTPALSMAQAALASAPAEARLSLDHVTLRAPVPAPGKILCIGRNYAAHAAEDNAPVPTSPVLFSKYNNTVIGPGEAIVLPPMSQQVDYEGELGVIIGRRARAVAEAEALSYIGGYTAFNDVSARDLQFLTSQWVLGKSPDTFGPMGPALVTADEIPDPQNLRLRTLIGDEVLQEGHTSEMIFSVAYLVSYLSQVITLEPGDIIATGTPSGVGYHRDPPRFLHAGDVVRIEIEKIGALQNPVVAA